MGAYKGNEDILRFNFILKAIVIILIIYVIINTIKIEQDDLQIKQLMIENRDLEMEYNELLKDNEANIEQIEWLNEQMVNLRGE